MSDMRTGEMTPYEQAVWQQINLQWADKHHGLIAGLRDGSLVALPVGDRWTVARHHPTGTSEVTLHYRDDEFHRANAAEDVLAAAQEPPR